MREELEGPWTPLWVPPLQTVLLGPETTQSLVKAQGGQRGAQPPPPLPTKAVSTWPPGSQEADLSQK